jgi:hypothetical protein
MSAESLARGVCAARPGIDAGSLRRAYLELLKLCLCDLAAAGTESVDGLADGHVASRELTVDQLSERADGRDWPLRGMTMSGLRRLDDLQSCVESVVRDGVAGDLIEAGVWRGGGSILMRATLDSLGAEDRSVWVADSFQGFPRADAPPGAGVRDYEQTLEPYLAVFDFLAVPLEEVKAHFTRFGLERGTRFVPGFFEDTLPELPDHEWSLIRLDADSYDPTLLALRYLYPRLSVGGYLIVDDYGALEECRGAVDRFRREHRIKEPLEQVDWTGVRWRRESDSEIAPPPQPHERRSRPDGAARAVSRPERRRVPSGRELELSRELADLRDRLGQAADELTRVKDFERQLREVTGSRSWRLTEPLRLAGRWGRRRAS